MKGHLIVDQQYRFGDCIQAFWIMENDQHIEQNPSISISFVRQQWIHNQKQVNSLWGRENPVVVIPPQHKKIVPVNFHLPYNGLPTGAHISYFFQIRVIVGDETKLMEQYPISLFISHHNERILSAFRRLGYRVEKQSTMIAHLYPLYQLYAQPSHSFQPWQLTLIDSATGVHLLLLEKRKDSSYPVRKKQAFMGKDLFESLDPLTELSTKLELWMQEDASLPKYRFHGQETDPLLTGEDQWLEGWFEDDEDED